MLGVSDIHDIQTSTHAFPSVHLPPKTISKTRSTTSEDPSVRFDDVKKILKATLESWESKNVWDCVYDTYKDLHKHPSTSGNESYIAGKAAKFLKDIQMLLNSASSFNGSFEVHENVGATTEGGPGVVGVMMNPGGDTKKSLAQLRDDPPKPVVLLRADMDGLPVKEETHCDYESENDGVMHACGHDMHTTTLMAATQMMVENRGAWTGTFIALFQPAEENGTGAMAMLKDGLYGKVPLPDYVMAGHVTPELAGNVSLSHGTAYSRSDSWRITIKGKGGHGSRPEACYDPIVCLAYVITRIQSIVARVVPSTEAGVITVGQIEGGAAENVIPESASMKVNIRSNTDELYAVIEKELRRVVAAEVRATLPEGDVAWTAEEQGSSDANPQFERISGLPLLKNTDSLRETISDAFGTLFGADRFDGNVAGVSGSEDFPHLAKKTAHDETPSIPLLYWRYGATNKEAWDAAAGDVTKIPSNHSKKFLPQLRREEVDDPLKVGTQALVGAALTLLREREGDALGGFEMV
ncbi:amidohydrolase [Aulographum hederae CBS 113979]|uniref:Amidohydrolase n=1 Tax=Aulographum hederae CBS 113979 TaxID=1176131 RepID=A0A6G1GTE4_9PEZI|nr:amidohydrolase [Aulographum hederae CBS 113979]